MPETFQAVYSGSKAFLDSFSVALSNELKDTGITVTCLMPGATETDFFKRADMTDTKVGSGDSTVYFTSTPSAAGCWPFENIRTPHRRGAFPIGWRVIRDGGADAVLDKAKAAVLLATDRVHVLRQAIMACRMGGTVSISGVYVGMGDKVPLGAMMNKGLTIKLVKTTCKHTPSRSLQKLRRVKSIQDLS